MKKKLKYKNEISTSIKDLIFIILTLIGFYILTQIFEVGDKKTVLIILGGFAILSFIIFVITGINAKRIRTKNNSIKNNGIKVYGKILEYKGDNSDDTTKYTLLVEYKDPYTQQLKSYETPHIGFSINDLGSRECSVYVYNDDIYVTEFVLVEDGEKSIWVKENPFLEELQKELLKAFGKLEFKFILIVAIVLSAMYILSLYTTEIVIPTIIGFLILIGILSFFKSKKVTNPMKQIITNQYEFNKIQKVQINDIEYCRDIPEKDNILKNYVLAKASGLVSEKNNIIGAFLLKWIKDGTIKIKGNNTIEKTNNNVFKNEDEKNLYNLIFNFREREQNIEKIKEGLIENKVQINKWLNESYLNIIKELKENNEVTANVKIDPNFMPIQEFILNEELQKQTLKLAGLRKFLKDYTLIQEREYIQIHILEEYMIYGYIFGIADEIEKRFNEIIPSFKEISDFKIKDIIEVININNPELSEKEKRSLESISKIFFDV